MVDVPNNAYDDQSQSGRRLKIRGKRRKPFAVECRFKGLSSFLDWFTHGRYETESRRDQAYAALVKKAEREYILSIIIEYRKRDD